MLNSPMLTIVGALVGSSGAVSVYRHSIHNVNDIRMVYVFAIGGGS